MASAANSGSDGRGTLTSYRPAAICLVAGPHRVQRAQQTAGDEPGDDDGRGDAGQHTDDEGGIQRGLKGIVHTGLRRGAQPHLHARPMPLPFIIPTW